MESLTIKDVNIIVHSDEINKFPELKKYFEQNGIRSYKKNEIQNAPEEIKNELLEYGSSILTNSRNEYASTDEARHTKSDYQCELCNQKHLKILFLVINKITKKEFWVGTTCVTEFGFENKRDIINIALEKAFKKEIADYDYLLASKKYPIVIPNELFKEYKKAKDQLKKDKKDFVQNKVLEIKKSLESAEKIKLIEKSIEEYVAKNKDADWVAKYDVIEWYERLSKDNPIRKKNEIIIDKLMLNGFYSEDDIAYIREENHRNLIRSIFINSVKNPHFIFQVHRNKLILKLKYNQNTISYEVFEDDLYNAYKKELYNKSEIKLDQSISKYTSVVRNNANMKLFLNQCDSNKIIESFNTTDNILFVESDQEYIYKLNLNDALEFLKTNMNIEEYIKSKDMPLKINKSKFNSYISDFISYKERVILNRIEGLKYSNK